MHSTDLDSTLFFVNHAAGKGRAGEIWRALNDSHPELDRSIVIQDVDPQRAIADLKAKLVSDKIQRVIAIGGDGTLHTVTHYLLQLEAGAAVGVISSGTGSDFARGLALPKRPIDALDAILQRAPQPLDALRLLTDSGIHRYAINIASAGVSGQVAVAVNALPRKTRWSYLRATFSALRKYRPTSCRVLVDGELFFEGSFFVVAVANGSFFGKGMHVAPTARPNDGLADVVLVPEVPLYQLPYRLPQFMTGRHLKLPFVLHRKARRVRIEPAPDLPHFELDGEPMSSGALELQILPKALSFYY